MDNENSWEFTADSQPGSGFRTPPPSSCLSADARVRMADGSLRPISAVAVGEMALSADGPRRVVHVVKSPLGARPLYRFEGREFAFTATHPFVVANASSEGAPAFLAVNAAEAVYALPGLGELGIGRLGAAHAPKLTIFSEATATAADAPSVISDEADAETEVFDLVLELDADGASAYLAGDDAQKYLVASEAPRFAFAGGDRSLHRNVRDGRAGARPCARALSGEQLPRPASIWHDRHLSRARFAGSKTHGTGGRRRAADACDGAGPRLNLLGDVSDGQPSNLAGAAGAAFGVLAATLAPPFRLACAMGWRQLEQAGPERSECLAIDIDTIELDGSLDVKLPGQELKIALAHGTAQLERSLAIGAGQGEHGMGALVHDTAYFTDWRPGGSHGKPWTVAFALSDDAAGAGTVPIARAYLPHDGVQQASFRSAAIFGTSGSKAGRLTFEVRRLTSAQVSVEREARRNWSRARAAAFAAALGKAAGNLIAEKFATYLRAFAGRISLHSAGLVPVLEQGHSRGTRRGSVTRQAHRTLRQPAQAMRVSSPLDPASAVFESSGICLAAGIRMAAEIAVHTQGASRTCTDFLTFRASENNDAGTACRS